MAEILQETRIPKYHPLKSWPQVSRYASEIDNLNPNPYLSVDLEWDIRTGNPTILGLSDGILTISCPWDEGKPYLLDLISKRSDLKVLGHNFVQADLGVLQREGVPIRLEQVEDTILWHWLTNMSLCKASKKVDDEEGEKRGRGFMNLFSFCAFHTDVPNWKDCRGDGCEGPCPVHDPFGYNGQDTYWPLKAFPEVLKRAQLMGVDGLYPLHRDVSWVLAKMSERGVLVDVPYIEKLRAEFAAETARIAALLPFNAESPKQIVDYFKGQDIPIANAQESAIRELCENYSLPELHSLLAYKELGDGVDRWFALRKFNYDKNEWEGYVDGNGCIHCSLVFFTSTGRLACFNPNLQNVAKRRKDRASGASIGERIRRAVIAPEGYYLYRADLKNAENRVFLHLAGHTDIPDTDFHEWMRSLIGIEKDDPFAVSLGSPRDAAKSVTHATDYMEGLKLVERKELNSPRLMREIAAGARIIFPDWTVWGKVVTFTGINLSQRAFGDATYANRKRALDIQSKYFAAFPKLRDLQKAITAQVEQERCVRPPTGYALASYGWHEERLKTAAAMWGSNPVAHVTKLALLNAEAHPRLIPVLQVHDELLFYVSKEYAPTNVASWIKECMEVEMPEIPRLKIPAEPSYGENWADQKKIGG